MDYSLLGTIRFPVPRPCTAYITYFGTIIKFEED